MGVGEEQDLTGKRHAGKAEERSIDFNRRIQELKEKSDQNTEEINADRARIQPCPP